MKTILVTSILSLFISTVKCQISFSNFAYKLKAVAGANGTKLSCTGAAFAVECSLKRKGIKIQGNYAVVDSQVILITPLSINGLKKKTADLSNAEQKQLLSEYSKYELDYFTNELHIEVINPTNQWVAIKSRYWFIWYFRVGEVPTAVGTKAGVQLFASTLIAGKVLTINAPVIEGDNFAKASYMVNDLMESLIIKR